MSKLVGLAVGTAVPVVIFSAVTASAPVAGGAAIMFGLKQLGFGVAQRGILTLAASGVTSGAVAEAVADLVEDAIDDIVYG